MSLQQITAEYLLEKLPEACLDQLVSRSTYSHLYTLNHASLRDYDTQVFKTRKESRQKCDEIYKKELEGKSIEELRYTLDINDRYSQGKTWEEVRDEVLDLRFNQTLLRIPVHGNVNGKSTIYFLWIYGNPRIPFISNDFASVKEFYQMINHFTYRGTSASCWEISLEDGKQQELNFR